MFYFVNKATYLKVFFVPLQVSSNSLRTDQCYLDIPTTHASTLKCSYFQVTDEALDLQALQETIRNRTLSLSQKFQDNVEEGLENCSQPENFEVGK